MEHCTMPRPRVSRGRAAGPSAAGAWSDPAAHARAAGDSAVHACRAPPRRPTSCELSVAVGVGSASMPITVVGSIAYDSVSDALRRAPADARRRGRALRAGRLLLRRGTGRRAGRRGLRRDRARRAAPPRSGHLRRGARPRGQDVLLARQVRLGPQLARDARHAAGRFRGLPAQALGALALLRGAVPGEHPARPAARGARAAARRTVRGARLDEPLDRSRARVAHQGDRRVRLPDPQRLRAAPADRQSLACTPPRGRSSPGAPRTRG